MPIQFALLPFKGTFEFVMVRGETTPGTGGCNFKLISGDNLQFISGDDLLLTNCTPTAADILSEYRVIAYS